MQWESIIYPCTDSVGALFLCISFKTDVNSYIVFSNPKPQLAHSG